MNLRQIANTVTQAINPNLSIDIWKSTGYTTASDGTQVATYDIVTVQGNVQELSSGDVKRMSHNEGLNVQSIIQKVYLNGNFEGVYRLREKGGDLLKWDGRTYLITMVFERWHDWCAVGVTLQMDENGIGTGNNATMNLSLTQGAAVGS